MQNFGGSKGPSSAVHDGSLADSEYTRISTETSLLNDHGKKLKGKCQRNYPKSFLR